MQFHSTYQAAKAAEPAVRQALLRRGQASARAQANADCEDPNFCLCYGGEYEGCDEVFVKTYSAKEWNSEGLRDALDAASDYAADYQKPKLQTTSPVRLSTIGAAGRTAYAGKVDSTPEPMRLAGGEADGEGWVVYGRHRSFCTYTGGSCSEVDLSVSGPSAGGSVGPGGEPEDPYPGKCPSASCAGGAIGSATDVITLRRRLKTTTGPITKAEREGARSEAKRKFESDHASWVALGVKAKAMAARNATAIAAQSCGSHNCACATIDLEPSFGPVVYAYYMGDEYNAAADAARHPFTGAPPAFDWVSYWEVIVVARVHGSYSGGACKRIGE